MQKQSKRIDVDPLKADRVTSSPRQQAYSIPFKEKSWLLGNRFQRSEKIDLAPQIQKNGGKFQNCGTWPPFFISKFQLDLKDSRDSMTANLNRKEAVDGGGTTLWRMLTGRLEPEESKSRC